MEMTGLWKAWKAKDASPSFHEPLGNLAKSRRDSHIPTAPATRAGGKVENREQVFHFSTAPNSFITLKAKTHRRRLGFAHRLAAGAPRRLRPKSNCRQYGEIVVVNAKK
jgi:hypothetical protein